MSVRAFIVARALEMHRLALFGFFVMMLIEVVAPLPDVVSVEELSFTLVPAVGAMVWFYAKGLVHERPQISRLDLLHLPPIALIYAGFLPLLTMSVDARRDFLSGAFDLTNPIMVWAIDLPPAGPSFITRVCGLDLGIRLR
ncbi:MAG: hypothetical protein AAFQ05_06600, partial [Pseudomonadota bacterium]